jgi:hypothetical protein
MCGFLLLEPSSPDKLLVHLPTWSILQNHVHPFRVPEVPKQPQDVLVPGFGFPPPTPRTQHTRCTAQKMQHMSSMRKGRWAGCPKPSRRTTPTKQWHRSALQYLRCDWISISRRSWCSIPSFITKCLCMTCTNTKQKTTSCATPKPREAIG